MAAVGTTPWAGSWARLGAMSTAWTRAALLGDAVLAAVLAAVAIVTTAGFG